MSKRKGRIVYQGNVIIEGGLHIHLDPGGPTKLDASDPAGLGASENGRGGVEPLGEILRAMQALASHDIETAIVQLPESAQGSEGRDEGRSTVQERQLAKPGDKRCPWPGCGVRITQGASACRQHARSFYAALRKWERGETLEGEAQEAIEASVHGET